MTRQRAYQLRQKAAGRCIICPAPLYSATHCIHHHLSALDRRRRNRDTFPKTLWERALEAFNK